MKKFLNDIRSAENPISGNRKIINTIAILLLGIALGTFSKFLDFRQAELREYPKVCVNLQTDVR